MKKPRKQKKRKVDDRFVTKRKSEKSCFMAKFRS